MRDKKKKIYTFSAPKKVFYLKKLSQAELNFSNEVFRESFSYRLLQENLICNENGFQHIETSQLTGFYMRATLAFNELKGMHHVKENMLGVIECQFFYKKLSKVTIIYK